MGAEAFDTWEAAEWEQHAVGYDRFFGSITSRVVGFLLDAASVAAGKRVLDVATGPGYVAGETSRRGAEVVGIDVADAMVSLAARFHPGIEFRRADAHKLPFAHASFDAVVGNFMILHLGQPERAIAELARVLAPEGTIALTVWDLPDRARLFGVFVDAIAEAGVAPPRDIPAAPDFFRFSVDDELERLLRDQGLDHCDVATLSFTHRAAGADEVWTGMLGGSVRTGALILSQPPDTRERVRAAFDRHLAEYRGADGFEIPVSVKLATGRRVSPG